MRTTPALILCLLVNASCTSEDPRGRFQSVAATRIDSIPVRHLSDQDISSMATDGRHWFITFHQRAVVVKTDLRFQETARYDRQGQGPGEMVTARDIALGENRLWVTDFEGRAIHRFDTRLTYLDRIPVDFRPFSILAFNDSVAWLGTMDMAFEDLYEVAGTAHDPNVTRIRSKQVANPPESILLHAGDRHFGAQFRPYTNRVTVYENGMPMAEFGNILRPERVEYEMGLSGPMPKAKIHQTAFTIRGLVCLVAGVAVADRQDVTCYTSKGLPAGLFSIRPGASVAATHGDTLFTYSPETQHVYRTLLDF